MSNKLNKEEFETALKHAVERREKVYSNFFALHFRWANDCTGAERDAHSFSELAKHLGFPNPETHVIPEDEPAPGFGLRDRISKLFLNALNSKGRSIIALHYAGHGVPNDSDELVLTTTFKGKLKKIAANSFLWDITTDHLIPPEDPVDTIIIFDCCHSFLATRNANPQSRLVEILSAGRDAGDPVAFGAGTKNSFTSKLLMEVRRRAQRGEKLVEMAAVIETLQVTSPVKKPSYAAKVGLGSICLPLSIDAARIDIGTPTDGLKATFSVHVSRDFTNEELGDLVEWLENLPKSKSSSLKLESVKPTNSMLFIFESDILCFHRIIGLPGVNLICEHRLLDDPQLFQGPSARYQNLPITDENRPPAASRQAPPKSASKEKSPLR